ncbi:helicase [Seminavis robusta]|uniref:Helicase n=1 Tax=Seminavis robusta TaxID=568900 RepID=A0A9N8F5E0_9STRA|nr:helicase [Seminavis robusta]|eukprot:Sro3351_g347090.1 helicase (403) ;mRNA; f:2494-3702
MRPGRGQILHLIPQCVAIIVLILHQLTQNNGVLAFATKNPSGYAFNQRQQRCNHFRHCNLLATSAKYEKVSPLFATKIEDIFYATTTNSTARESIQKPSESKQAESHLENDANLSTFAVNNPTWDQNIAALLEYKKINGTVNIPETSKEYPNLALWIWCLRKQKGRLVQKQIAQLDSIGFLWTDAHVDKNDRQWMAMFEELEEYKAINGHCRVPVKQGKLGGWVKTQRRLYTMGNFRRDRQELLESIGFEWRLKRFVEVKKPEHETLWNFQYAALCKFKEQHGHTRVPRPYPENKELGWWVNNQRMRSKDGTLRPDRKEKLDKIGFVWDFDEIFEKSWLESYEELKQGNSKKLALGSSLLSWAFDQRALYAKDSLGSERKAMLDEIGFEWWELPAGERMDGE